MAQVSFYTFYLCHICSIQIQVYSIFFINPTWTKFILPLSVVKYQGMHSLVPADIWHLFPISSYCLIGLTINQHFINSNKMRNVIHNARHLGATLVNISDEYPVVHDHDSMNNPSICNIVKSCVLVLLSFRWLYLAYFCLPSKYVICLILWYLDHE